MYLIQFRRQFSLFIQEMGAHRPTLAPPPEKKEVFWLYWGPFCYFLLHGGCLFLGLPPPPTKISAGAHDCKEVSRAYSPEIFLCDHNLVSSGHVLLQLCLKNDKNNDKL